jgi:hypothetical protein
MFVMFFALYPAPLVRFFPHRPTRSFTFEIVYDFSMQIMQLRVKACLIVLCACRMPAFQVGDSARILISPLTDLMEHYEDANKLSKLSDGH